MEPAAAAAAVAQPSPSADAAAESHLPASDEVDPVASSLNPRSIYLDECKKRSTHINSDLVQMLPSTSTAWDRIRVLDLSRNCLGKVGVISLLAVIRRCKNLLGLNLSDNYISNEFVVEFCQMLLRGENPHLMYLNFSKNPISYAAGKALVQVLRTRELLCDVRVENTLMNPALAQIVMNKSVENREALINRGVKVSIRGIHTKRTTSAVAAETEAEPEGAASAPFPSEDEEEGTIFHAIMRSHPSSQKPSGLSALGDVHRELRHQDAVRPSVAPEDDWYGMETMWNLAASAAPRDDGWAGLASVMALIRQDRALASMY